VPGNRINSQGVIQKLSQFSSEVPAIEPRDIPILLAEVDAATPSLDGQCHVAGDLIDS
jgi:hypothetical protein